MSGKDYTIRETKETDFQGISDFLSAHAWGPKQLDWIRWKYLDNPDGPARVFVAEDSEGKMVGLRTLLPRRFSSSQTGTFTVMQGIDAFVATELRGKGIYSKLYSFAESTVNLSKIFYPNELSIGFNLRIGARSIGPIKDYWFPVEIGPLVAEKYSGLIAPLADVLSRIYSVLWLGGYPHDLRMKPIAKFEKDFTVDTRLIHGIRSADYLNWRFINNPMRKYSAYEFREGEESIGYCVYEEHGSSAHIFDFITNRRRRNCLRMLVEHCRRKHVTNLRFKAIGLKLRSLGFLYRGSPIHCFVHKVPQGKWMITLSDKD